MRPAAAVPPAPAHGVKSRAVVPSASSKFPTKLRQILEEPLNRRLVRWEAATQTIRILDKAAFREEVIPRYFKLSSQTSLGNHLLAQEAKNRKMYDSFVRQLNYYGFYKRERGIEAYSVKDDPKIAAPRDFDRLCRRLPEYRADHRPTIADVDAARQDALLPPKKRAKSRSGARVRGRAA